MGKLCLWHHLFEHPSNEVISAFFKNLGIFEGNKDPCDVHFKAKCENKACDLFELIHCDI